MIRRSSPTTTHQLGKEEAAIASTPQRRMSVKADALPALIILVIVVVTSTSLLIASTGVGISSGSSSSSSSSNPRIATISRQQNRPPTPLKAGRQHPQQVRHPFVTITDRSPPNHRHTDAIGGASSSSFSSTLSSSSYTYSSYHCGGEDGVLDVMGYKASGDHYCMLENMCIRNGKPLLLVRRRKEEDVGRGWDKKWQQKTFKGLPLNVFGMYPAIREIVVVSAPPTDGNSSGSSTTITAEEHELIKLTSLFRNPPNNISINTTNNNSRFLPHLTAYIGTSYGQRHITHAMEPQGYLFKYLWRLGYFRGSGGDGGGERSVNGLGSSGGSVGVITPLPPLPRLARVLVSAPITLQGINTVVSGSFVDNFFRMIGARRRGRNAEEREGEGSDASSPEVPLLTAADVSPLYANEGKCFAKVLMVGSSYDPFDGVPANAYYKHRDWYVRNVMGVVGGKSKEVGAASEQLITVPSPSSNGNPSNSEGRHAPSNRPKRRVLFAHRTSKRRVINNEELIQWLTKALPMAAPQYEWEVKQIVFGDLMSKEDQKKKRRSSEAVSMKEAEEGRPAAVGGGKDNGSSNGLSRAVQYAQWADIIIGIHGADLTNLVFMRPHTAVIELNMLFFFEPRFTSMCASLQLHYLAWTCTHRTCTTPKVYEGVVPNGRSLGNAEEGRKGATKGNGKEMPGGGSAGDASHNYGYLQPAGHSNGDTNSWYVEEFIVSGEKLSGHNGDDSRSSAILPLADTIVRTLPPPPADVIHINPNAAMVRGFEGDTLAWYELMVAKERRALRSSSGSTTSRREDGAAISITKDEAGKEGYYSRFSWPFMTIGELGCVGCNILSVASSMQRTIYSAQRDSDIIFTARELWELLIVIKEAAVRVGTVPNTNETKVVPFMTQWEALVASGDISPRLPR